MSKPEMYEFFHSKKKEIEEEAQEQVEKAKKEGNIYYNEWKNLSDQFERQKQDLSNVYKVKDDYVFANGALKEEIEEMKKKISTLENKLSYTVTEKTKAVFNIEELCGELSEDKKKNLEMYLNG